MVPSIFLVTIVKQVAGAIAVAARVRGCPGAVLGLVWLFVCNVNTVWCAVVVIYELGGASDKNCAHLRVRFNRLGALFGQDLAHPRYNAVKNAFELVTQLVDQRRSLSWLSHCKREKVLPGFLQLQLPL
jgi:hypothetical protein